MKRIPTHTQVLDYDWKPSKQCDVCIVWPYKGQKWIRKIKLHLHAWVWRHPGHRSFLLANYCAMYASASTNPTSWKIQNKYFYSPYSNEILYTKELEYREYFTRIAIQKMTKSSRDIQNFVDMKFRIFGQAVSKYMIVSVCVMFWRHLTPVWKVILWGLQWWLLFKRGGKYSPRYLY
jgi:hypothetical protein